MTAYSMTQLCVKQSLLETHTKRMKRLNHLLADTVVNEMDTDILNAIESICNEIIDCTLAISDAAEGIGTYAVRARDELVAQEKMDSTKTLKATLDRWDKAREANAGALAEGKLPVINDVEDSNPYIATVGEAKQDG